MRDEGPAWFDDDLEAPPRPGRRRAIAVACATLPWLVLSVVWLAGLRSPAPAEGTPTGAAAPTTAAEPAEADVAGAQEHATDAPDATEPPGGPASTGPTEPTTGDASAVATAVARAWLADVGPDLTVDGIAPDRRGYLEHVTVRRIDVIGPDAAVVTLGVVVLERDDDRYVDVAVRQIAVPLTLTATQAHPAGTPWWLPHADDLRRLAPDVDPVEDAEALTRAEATLVDAGYRDVEVVALARGEGDLVVATVRATTPQGEVVDGDVWLVATSDGYATHVASSPDGGDPA